MKLLIGTKKGAWTLESDNRREHWSLSDPIFFGHIINHFMPDPRNPAILLVAAKTGHLGPTVFRSLDGGTTWSEASSPPAFPSDQAYASNLRKSMISTGDALAGESLADDAVDGGMRDDTLAVDRVFWLTPGHKSEPAVWYVGTAPAGLFRSEDDGDTWASVDGFNNNPHYKEWATQGATPDGQLLHSILIDPRDSKHMYLAVSIGGVFESLDRGENWRPINRGCAADFMPDPDVEYGHDPHCVVAHPENPDRLYQQNHCGIYRLDRPSEQWVRIGENMPKAIGDIGFPIVVHPRDRDCAWVFPMDGTEVWPRTSPGGKPCTYVTRDAGKSWSRQDKGLPEKNAFFTVKRQSMTCDSANPLGLYFGTTSGEIWASRDEGESWVCIASHLPEVYSLEIDSN